jgi:dienelactone hydrolase
MGQSRQGRLRKVEYKVRLCRVSPPPTPERHPAINLIQSSYCFGAPYVCESLADDTCTAGAFAHPAFLKESHFFNLKSIAPPPPLLCYLLTKAEPLFLSCAEIDHTFDTAGRNRAVDIMIKEGKDYQVQLFHGVEHGFALRGDVENAYERKFSYLVMNLR